jgi:TRAP-type C4-dicarboxylate transport system permease small subunit
MIQMFLLIFFIAISAINIMYSIFFIPAFYPELGLLTEIEIENRLSQINYTFFYFSLFFSFCLFLFFLFSEIKKVNKRKKS